MPRPTHHVSVKISLLNPSGTRVLLTRLHDGRYGLPGGHLEYGETPEIALIRELDEELGISYAGELSKVDFWKDPVGDRILLGFVGRLDELAELNLNQAEITAVYWANLEDIESRRVQTETYDAFLRTVLTSSRLP